MKKRNRSHFLICSLIWYFLMSFSGLHAQQLDKKTPNILKGWEDWVTWNEFPSSVPSFYHDHETKLLDMPSSLDLRVNDSGGVFSFSVFVFYQSWIRLPGNTVHWPLQVSINSNQSVPVMNRDGYPHVKLMPGQWEINGSFRWQIMPQVLQIPDRLGVLTLVKNGSKEAYPIWDNQSRLWLKRTNQERTDKDFLSVQVYRNLVDGSPMRLLTEVELTVAGKSREEELGGVVPEGWNISSLNSALPCAVDDEGFLKTQVRAGKWKIEVEAFSTTPVQSIQFKQGVQPIKQEEFVSLQNQPGFRLIEFTGVQAVDASQTTFPDKWRSYPLYLWDTSKPFQVVEKMRGMGQKKPPGFTMRREFWLDENGKQLTYRDAIQGQALQAWRLDAAKGQRLGAAKIGDQSQLITKNPDTGLDGVEVRVRNLALEAVGRMDRQKKIPATGWYVDAEKLESSLHLPPGWRLFAIFGADWSNGDWLTSWSLLDVFFLLVFTVAIFRLWGWKIGMVAFLTFVISYHEPGAPRAIWVVILGALILYRAIPSGRAKKVALLGLCGALGLLLLGLVPFAAKQVQQMIYPQLEPSSVNYSNDYNRGLNADVQVLGEVVDNLGASVVSRPLNKKAWKSEKEMKKYYNFQYDSKAKIQTGPAVPDWTWRTVTFGWSGPVSAKQNISMILIPSWLQRVLIALRVGFIVGLLYLLLRYLPRFPKLGENFNKALFSLKNKTATNVLIGFLCFLGLGCLDLKAQIPDQNLLDQLRSRLLEDKLDLKNEAQIPQVDLQLIGNELLMDVEVHTSKEVAVPLPGKLSSWSPLSVNVDEGEHLPVARLEGFLWIVLPEGTHKIQVKGIIPNGDWEWAFHLKPQYVNIDAPDWVVTGIKENGIPENQVFFTERNRTLGAEAAYDRENYAPVLQVTRSLELGLVWQAHTTVQRLSPLGKAVSISLPLLSGERILTPGFTEKNGRLEIRLGAQQQMASWESEMNQTSELKLKAEKNDQWVEQWKVQASSVWNLSLTGLSPVFENAQTDLSPVWRPWPGEEVNLVISRPQAVVGDTMTIRKARHDMSLGVRQRTSSLVLDVKTSLGSDFVIGLEPDARISSLKLGGVETPVRKDGNNVIVPLRPGEQTIELKWKTLQNLKTRCLADKVQLPTETANTSTIMRLSSSDRWILWAAGPTRGPAIRMWGIFITALLFGWLLGKTPHSPLKSYEWIFFLLGLTQISVFAGFFVVAWMFAVALRGKYGDSHLHTNLFNTSQVLIVLGLIPVVGILLFVLHQGLLGTPEMRIAGEGSRGGTLIWFESRGENTKLPTPTVFSVSIWWYRGLMLLWAIWLAFSVLRWAHWCWVQLGLGGFWKQRSKKENVPSRSPSLNEAIDQDSAK